MKTATRRGVVVLALLALVGLGFVAWSVNRAPAPVAVAPGGGSAGSGPAQGSGGPPGGAAAARPVAVEVARVSVVDFADEVSAVGSLKARESVTLRPETSGRVASIAFRDGALVNQGDLLLTLDAAIPDAEVAQARANLALVQSTHRRNQELLERKFISAQALDASAAALKVQEAALQLAEAKAGKMRIRAPFRGVLGLRDVSVGTYVKDGEALINLEDIDSLRVDFRLPETYLARLAKGQAIEVASDALPGQRFTATLDAIDPQIDPNGRSIAVRARLDNVQGQLRPGMFVRLRLIFGERKGVLMMPEEAVIPGAQPAVFRVIEGKAERVTVRLGNRRDAQVEVVEGLAAGDMVVSAGQMKLRPGSPVRPVGQDTPASQ